MSKPFKAKEPKSGLWVAPDDKQLPGLRLTESEKEAQTFEGEAMRKYFEKLGYEIVEVK